MRRQVAADPYPRPSHGRPDRGSTSARGSLNMG